MAGSNPTLMASHRSIHGSSLAYSLYSNINSNPRSIFTLKRSQMSPQIGGRYKPETCRAHSEYEACLHCSPLPVILRLPAPSAAPTRARPNNDTSPAINQPARRALFLPILPPLLHLKPLRERIDKADPLQRQAMLSLISASNDFIHHHHYTSLTKNLRNS